MKKIKCKNCQNIWVIKDKSLEHINICPFCGAKLKEEIDLEQIDSLDKLIYHVISKMGVETINDINRFTAIMIDIAPDLKKEIRIFSKNVTGIYAGFVSDIICGEINEVEPIVNKMRFLLVENEGLSENWAELICNGLHGAAKYLNGDIPTKLVDLDVEDYSVPSNPFVNQDLASQKDSETTKSLKNTQQIVPAIPNQFKNVSTSTNYGKIPVIPNSTEKTPKYKKGPLAYFDSLTDFVSAFGTYHYDEYGNKKALRWRILEKTEDRALMITEMGIDTIQYDSRDPDSYLTKRIVWKTSEIRLWLNTYFYNEAFSESEKEHIISTKILDEPNKNRLFVGNETKDKVFLLSIPEVQHYFSSSEDAWAVATPYAKSNGAYVDNNGNSWWWLRTHYEGYYVQSQYFKYQDSYPAAAIAPSNLTGDIISRNMKDNYITVRPAIWVKK